MIQRRNLLVGAGTLAVAASVAHAAPAKVLKVGTQKGAGILMAARQRGSLESLLKPLGIDVQWVEFQFGPPMLEAMRVGSIDIGLVGDTPPIFSQAANGDLLYVAAMPSGASALLLPAGSTLKTLQDLKGKRIAFARGSSSHNLTVAAVEKAGLRFDEITPVQLAPADAAAAFERGSVDVWTIWDPYYAIYELRPGVRVLAESTTIAPQNSFFIARRAYVEANQEVTAKVVQELGRVGAWARDNRAEVAQLVSSGTGVPLEPTLRATKRAPLQVLPMSDVHVQAQQDIADRFHRLGIIPNKIRIADQVWHLPA
jgi:NitT/TauT family transport system substrate-binding protein/sulfonate transport system substrate-binding protein